MKTILSTLTLAVAVFYLNTAHAQPFEEVCHGEIFSIREGMCQCKATGDFIDPWDKGVREKCVNQTRIKKICLSESDRDLNLQYRDGKCFCPYSRSYMPDEKFPYSESNKYSKDMEKFEEILHLKIKECRVYKEIIDSKKVSLELYKKYFETLKKIESDLTNTHACIGMMYPVIPHDPDTISAYLRDQSPGARTVKIVAQLQGKNGGKVLKITRRPNIQRWDDGRDSPGEQGNPSNAVEVFGKVLGDFLGFKVIDENTLQLPDINEVKGGINKLKLKDRTVLSANFYPSRERGVSARMYLENFTKDTALPIEEFDLNGDQTYFLHDMDYHVFGLILMPEDLLILARLQSQAIFDFEKYSKDHFPALYHDPQFKYVIQEMINQKVEDIDLSTGKITLMYDSNYENFRSPREFKYNHTLCKDMGRLLGDTHRYDFNTKKYIYHIARKPSDYLRSMSSSIVESHIHDEKLRSEYEAALTKFLEEKKNDPNYSKDVLFPKEEYYDDVKKWAKELKALPAPAELILEKKAKLEKLVKQIDSQGSTW